VNLSRPTTSGHMHRADRRQARATDLGVPRHAFAAARAFLAQHRTCTPIWRPRDLSRRSPPATGAPGKIHNL
jgi:hypothetical protein